MSLCLVTTGGTIAAWREDVGIRMVAGIELLELLPEDLAADIEVRDIALEPSWNLSVSEMQTIAQTALDAIDSGFDGAVVTHGTDTLEDSIFLTDLLAGPQLLAPLVFTAAMRFLSDKDGDALRNLTDSVRLAKTSSSRHLGPVLCMSGLVHAAREVRKVDATSIRAFSSDPFEPVGRLNGVKPVITRTPSRPWPSPPKEIESQVAVVKSFPGVDGGVIRYFLDSGVRGLVIEGTGAMNLPRTLLPEIERAASDNISVVITSSSLVRGGLNQPSVGSGVLHDLGAIGSYGLSTVKARIALMVALGSCKTVDQVRDWFGTAFGGQQPE